MTYIEPPPHPNATPEHVLKYLARYLTGGPISMQCIADHQRDDWFVVMTGPARPRWYLDGS